AHVGKLEIRAAGMTFLEAARWHLWFLILRRMNFIACGGLFCVVPCPKGVVKQLGTRGLVRVQVDISRGSFPIPPALSPHYLRCMKLVSEFGAQDCWSDAQHRIHAMQQQPPSPPRFAPRHLRCRSILA